MAATSVNCVSHCASYLASRTSPTTSVSFPVRRKHNAEAELRSAFNGLKVSGTNPNFLRFSRCGSVGKIQCAVLAKESYGVKSVQGTGRTSMEDTFAFFVDKDVNKPSFFGVFDGHGGKAVSEFLKAEFWKVYQQKLSSTGDYIKATTIAYQELDEATLVPPKGLFGALRERGLGGSKCGSTAATLLLLPREKKFITANVGDAKIVLSRDKKAIPLSVDHKPDILEERLRIEAKNPFPKNPLVRNVNGVWRVGGLLALSRAFGDVYLKNWSDGYKDGASGGYGLTAEPSIFFEDLTPEDEWIVLGTDGLFDFIPQQEIVDICNSSDDGNPQLLAEKLVKVALDNGSTDDISVIVVKLPKFD